MTTKKALYTRITLDLDTKDKHKIIYVLSKTLFKIPKITNIFLRKSNSGNYHLIIWTKKDYTEKQIYNLRKLLFDDLNRIRNDKIRKYGKQTLFYTKKYPRK